MTTGRGIGSWSRAMTADQNAGKLNPSQGSNPMVIGWLMAAPLITVADVAPAVRAECQTNQTVSGEEICQDDDTNGACNLMEH